MSNINSIIIDIGMEMLTHPKRIVKFYLCKSSMVPPSSKMLPPFSHEIFRLQVVIAKYEACSCCSGGAVVCSRQQTVQTCHNLVVTTLGGQAHWPLLPSLQMLLK